MNQSCHSSSNTVLKNSRIFLMYCMCVIEFMNNTIQFGQCFTHIYVIHGFNINFIHNGFQRKFSRKFIGLGGSHKRLHEICMLSLTSPHTPYHSPQHLLISCITCPSCLLPKRVFFFPYCSPWHPPSSFVSASSITQNKSRCPSMGVA